ncbi:MAG TPA: DUF302 domain-containing protein [Geobacteraceae bacterium]|nr:DUF302 domain-containing protein [Geobacteraceae bacterium]
MITWQGTVHRLTVISSRSFETVVAAFEAAIGHPDMSEFQNRISGTNSYVEMERLIQSDVGKSGFMELARFDLGAILRKEQAQEKPKIVRFLIGNPLIMKEMVKHVPDAGSYAPVTVLIDERPDGVHLSYDLMAGFLDPYGNVDALKVAWDLDSRVEKLLREAGG